MISHSIKNELFEILEQVLECVITYEHELRALNIYVDFKTLDKIVSKNVNIDVIKQCVWYYSLEEVADELLETKKISVEDHNKIIMYTRFGLKENKWKYY
mgnify:CR=1 FL=1